MARKKDLRKQGEKLELYTKFNLFTSEQKEEFEALAEEQKTSRINGWFARNKEIVLAQQLKKMQTLKSDELNSLDNTLQTYLIKIVAMRETIKEKEIREKEMEKEKITDEYNKKMERLNNEIAALKG